MEKFKSVPFKEWIREQIKMNINPILYKKGFKKGRATSYVRECNEIIQMITFRFRQDEVWLEAGINPIYFPSDYSCMWVISEEDFPISRNRIIAQNIYTEDNIGKSSWFWGTRSRTAQEWQEFEDIINRVILPQFDIVQSLDEFMKSPMREKYNEYPSKMWKGIFLYIDAVYDCLIGDFDIGMQKLKKAQGCKRSYLDYLAKMEKEYAKNKDDFYRIYSIIDEFCKVVAGENYNKDTFLSVYESVCDETKKWFKV